MEALWNAEIEVILWLQSLGSWLAAPMQFASLFGNEEFFLLLLPVIYWSLSASLGLRVGLMLLLSANINHLLKLAFHGPRPYWYSRRVMALSVEATFGMPSAHAQNTVAIWGLLAVLLRRRWALTLAVVLILAIGLSRLYLGVHFASDVLAGWLIGAALLWMFVRWEAAVAAWLPRLQLGRQIGLALVASLALVGLSTQLPLLLSGWQIPEVWVQNAIAGAGEAPEPLVLNNAISTAGALFGLASGAAWLYSRGWFSTTGSLWKRLIRYLIGVIGVVIFWYGLGAVLPRGDTLLAYTLRYLRYTLVGLWISGLAPALFVRLRLAEPVLGLQAATRQATFKGER